MNLNTPTLIVPIDVQALCVGNPDVSNNATVLSPEADFSELPWSNSGVFVNESSYTSTKVMIGSSPFNGQVPAQFGIHLHWALPDGLTQAISAKGQQDATPMFPSVPNRWLLSRIILDLTDPATPVTTVQSWVIESDRLMATQDPSLPPVFPQPSVPVNPTLGGQTYNFVGQAFDLDGWSETTASRLTPLTATGYGNTAFAAYYPNSSTVFGFLDTLDGANYNAATCTVHYQVAGWYSDPTSDPMNGETYDEKDNPFHWKYTKGSQPQSTICNGIITNITWNPATQYLNTNTNPLSVAMGNNAPEAFAALLANINNNKTTYPNAELLLDLLQFNYLSKSGQIPDALQKFEETLHKASFAPFRSGSRWKILSNDPKKKHHKEIKSFKTKLEALNALQAAADSELVSLNTQSQQLFADWVKYLVLSYDNPTGIPAGLDANNAQTFVTAETTPLAAAVAAYQADYITPLQQAQTTLAGELPKHLRLVQSEPADNYWQAQNPVLIMSGQDIVPTVRYGQDGAGSDDNKLKCRLDSELLTGLALDAGFVTGSSATTLNMSMLPSLSSQPADAPATLANTLLQETFLLSNLLQNTVAQALVVQGGSGNPATIDFTGTVTGLQTNLAAFLGGTPPTNATYTGDAPASIMIFTYAGTPWLPIEMQYSIFYQPVQAVDTASGAPVPYQPDFINSQFSWNTDSIELQYQNATLQAGATYTGTVTLTPNARYDLVFQH